VEKNQGTPLRMKTDRKQKLPFAGSLLMGDIQHANTIAQVSTIRSATTMSLLTLQAEALQLA
jgi:hypothetical protein